MMIMIIRNLILTNTIFFYIKIQTTKDHKYGSDWHSQHSVNIKSTVLKYIYIYIYAVWLNLVLWFSELVEQKWSHRALCDTIGCGWDIHLKRDQRDLRTHRHGGIKRKRKVCKVGGDIRLPDLIRSKSTKHKAVDLWIIYTFLTYSHVH